MIVISNSDDVNSNDTASRDKCLSSSLAATKKRNNSILKSTSLFLTQASF